MSRGTRAVLWAATVLLLIGAGVWLGRSIEWVDVEVPTLPKGPALHDPFYAAKQLAIRLGARVASPRGFAQLPPAGATLVLASPRWSLFPGGAEALQRWVEAGGRLVVFPTAAWDDDEATGWLPVSAVPAPGDGGAASAPSPSPSPRPSPLPSPRPSPAPSPPPGLPAGLAGLIGGARCAWFREPQDVAPAYGTARAFFVCGHALQRLTSESDAAWQLDAGNGPVLMRVPLGRGSVVASTIDGSFANAALLRHDNALVFAAALQLQAGDEVWFIDDDSRVRFLALLWQHGAPAVLLALGTVALALCRGGVRFGPPLAEPPLARRSIGEQVRRTAAFVARGGGASLHRAALRALEQEARRSVAGYAGLLGSRERSEAIARRTGTDPAALAGAMDPLGTDARARRGVAARIALIEQARRALLPPHLQIRRADPPIRPATSPP